MSSTAATAARPPGLLYAVDDWPPVARLLLLGVQYAVLDAIYLVLVAIILRHAHVTPAASVDAMGVACVGLAIGTALQALPRGPVGSGFLAPPVFSATYLAPSVLAAEIGGMRLVFGMTVFAGVVEVLIGLALNRLRIVITPVLSGLTVFVVGLQLGIVGIGETLDVQHEALPGFPLHLLVATGTLLTCVALSIWGRGILKLVCTLVGLLVGMAGADMIGLIAPAQLATIGHTAWVALPHPFLTYGFEPALAPAFLAAGVAAALRAVGVVTTCQRINDAGWQRPDMANVRRGVLADGLANVIGGALGTPGMSVAPSMVGISAATGATSRAIAFVAAAVLLVIAASPRLSGFFLLVPSEVAGGLLVFTASFLITGGMEIMVSRRTDTRAVYVIGISTMLALGRTLFPHYFDQLSPALRSVAGSSLALGLTAALVLTLLFRLGTSQRAETGWTASEASIEAALGFLRGQAQGWKLPADVTATAATHLREVLEYLLRTHPAGLEGSLRLGYDGLALRVEVLYAGSAAAHLPPPREPHPTPQEHRQDTLDNEEAAVILGLRSFLHSLSADRKLLRLRHGRVMVRLGYAA